MPDTNWYTPPPEPVLEHEIVRVCGVSPLTARLLVNRGVLTPREVEFFLDGTFDDLHSPEDMRDLTAVANAVSEAAAAGETILVYGDYDVDGMTATAILVKAIWLLGGKAAYHIPLRSDGYGVHPEPLLRAAEQGIQLAVTVDCGITAHEAVLLARAHGMRLLITDHHQPQGCLPDTLVVNPRRMDCLYPCKDLAGAGVALKLAQFLLGKRFQECAGELLGLACLGTIADVVSLTGENRLLVRWGLSALRRNGGLDALASAVGLPGEPTVRDVAYLIAPRLNAAGRLGDARLGVELLLSDDPLEQKARVEELMHLNDCRRDLEERIMAEILATVSGWNVPPPAAVFSGESWHPGVTGVVASRLARRLDRPVAVISVEGDMARGSVRSRMETDVFSALRACAQYLTEFGGHRCAAGFSLHRDQVSAFTKAFTDEVACGAQESTPSLKADAVVRLSDLSLSTVEEIARLAPWGSGNPEPLLVAENVDILDARPVGREGAHLKLGIRQAGNARLSGIAFRRGEEADELLAKKKVDLLFTPLINEWQGRRSVELRVVQWSIEACLMNDGAGKNPANFLEALELTEKETPPTLLAACLSDESLELNMDGPDPSVRRGQLIDWRNCTGRKMQLPVFLNDGVPTVVVVGTPRRAPLVTSVLRYRAAVPHRDGFTFLHPDLAPKRYESIRSCWRKGQLACLVLAAEDLRSIEEVPRMVVYDLPYDWATWDWLSSRASDCVLLFEDRDSYRNRRILQTLAPGRRCIGGLYMRLRRMGDQRGQCVIRRDSVAHNLRACLGLPVASWTVMLGLDVLVDLGLVSYEEEDSGCVRVQCHAVKGKQGLAASHTFRRVHAVKRCSLAYQRHFAEADAYDIAGRLGLNLVNGGDRHDL